MATLRNVSVSLLRILDTTHIAAALRHNARKNRRILNSWSFYQPKHSNADFAVPVSTKPANKNVNVYGHSSLYS